MPANEFISLRRIAPGLGLQKPSVRRGSQSTTKIFDADSREFQQPFNPHGTGTHILFLHLV